MVLALITAVFVFLVLLVLLYAVIFFKTKRSAALMYGKKAGLLFWKAKYAAESHDYYLKLIGTAIVVLLAIVLILLLYR